MRRHNQISAWPGGQVANHTGFEVDRWFHTRSISEPISLRVIAVCLSNGSFRAIRKHLTRRCTGARAARFSYFFQCLSPRPVNAVRWAPPAPVAITKQAGRLPFSATPPTRLALQQAAERPPPARRQSRRAASSRPPAPWRPAPATAPLAGGAEMAAPARPPRRNTQGLGGGSFMRHMRLHLAMAARVRWRSNGQGARLRPNRRRAPFRSAAAARQAPNNPRSAGPRTALRETM